MGLLLAGLGGRILAFAKLLPVWVWVLAAVLAWGAWQRHTATRATKAAAVAEQRAAVEAATAKAESEAREHEQELAVNVRKATDAYATNLAAANRTAAAARTERDRLRNALGSVQTCAAAPSASAAARADAALRTIADECPRAVEALGDALGRERAKVKGLQDHLRAIGAASAPEGMP